jgi:hypothetical protein
MFSSYRALFARAQTQPLAVASGLAWLSFTSYVLAIILAVHAATCSFGAAGGAVAAFSATSSLLAPARGRFIDRRGVTGLVVLAVGHACCAAGLVVGCAFGQGAPLLLVCAGLAGATAPPLIATARASWTRVAGPSLAPTAHALNAALADAAQLLSPALVGVLTGLLVPAAALAAVLTGATVAAGLIALTGRPSPPTTVQRRVHGVWGIVRESPGLRTVVVCDLAIGLWMGAFEVAVTSVAAHSGGAALAAVPLSASALGSIVVSLWSGTGRLGRPAAWRYLVGCSIVAAVLPFTLLEESVAGIAGVAVVVGIGFALLNVALFELLDHVAAPGHAVEAFTWLTTANAAGTAGGAALAAQLAAPAALLLVCCGAAAAAVIAFSRRSTLQATRDQTPFRRAP